MTRSERAADLLKRGLCRNHTKNQAATGKKVCQICLDRKKEARARRVAQGVCPSHPNQKLISGTISCEICKTNNKIKAARLKSEGRCPKHPNQPWSPGKSCPTCTDYIGSRQIELKARSLCVSCLEPSEAGKTRCRTCLDKLRQRTERIKNEVILAYGGKCACCGEIEQQFLTLDHKNNDGATHRKEIGILRGGAPMWDWAQKNGYPDTLDLMCYNCNCGRRLGICPHKLRAANASL